MFPVMSLYDDILRELICPKCKGYLERSINMCIKGHNICNRCQAHISPSANCKEKASGQTNVALENIVATVMYPCPFVISEEVPCAWSGIPFDIESHIKHSHDSETVEGTGESEWIRLSLPLGGSLQKAIFTLDKIFFAESSIRKHMLYFSVFHVGHKDDSSIYRYDFEIQKPDAPQKIYSELDGICHNYGKNSDDVKATCERVMLPLHSIQKYLTDEQEDTAVSCIIKIRTTTKNEDVEMMETTQPAVSSKRTPKDSYFK